MDQFYEKCHINPASVDFIEAHGTGTKVSLLIHGRYVTACNDKLCEELLMATLFEFIAFVSFQSVIANFEFWLVTKNFISNSFF
jgi:hypothetical protein